MARRFDIWDPTEDVDRRHVRAAAAAALVSFVVHLLLFYGLAHLSFRWLPFLPLRPEERRWKPFELSAVEPTPKERRPDSFAEASREGPSVPELLRELRHLRRDPEEAVIQPPSPLEGTLAEVTPLAQQPPSLPRRIPFEPRQDILAIDETLAAVELKHLERRRIPKTQRVPEAPVVIFEADWRERLREPLPEAPPGGVAVPLELAGRHVYGARRSDEVGPRSPPVEVAPAEEPFVEPPSTARPFTPLEKALKVTLETYVSPLDSSYGYFRLSIGRLNPEVLPVLPKDVLFLQDASNSMSEQRLHFCRQGLRRCLNMLHPGDRFNVYVFKEETSRAFESWVHADPEHVRTALEVIDAMHVGGNTDIFGSVRKILDLPREPGRPVIAILVSDGIPTVGATRSSDIIGGFTRLNDGGVSAFAVGTSQNANDYLLGLLSYCNRGEASVVTRGRWEIPEAIEALFRSVSRPVLSDLRFRFASSAGCEAYPVLTPNLYLDRSLVIHGRYRRPMPRLAFQAVGRSLDRTYDMVFDLDLEKDGRRGDESIRTEWARQKIFYLLAEYARREDAQLRMLAREVARGYRVPIPYGEQP